MERITGSVTITRVASWLCFEKPILFVPPVECDSPQVLVEGQLDVDCRSSRCEQLSLNVDLDSLVTVPTLSRMCISIERWDSVSRSWIAFGGFLGHELRHVKFRLSLCTLPVGEGGGKSNKGIKLTLHPSVLVLVSLNVAKSSLAADAIDATNIVIVANHEWTRHVDALSAIPGVSINRVMSHESFKSSLDINAIRNESRWMTFAIQERDKSDMLVSSPQKWARVKSRLQLLDDQHDVIVWSTRNGQASPTLNSYYWLSRFPCHGAISCSLFSVRSSFWPTFKSLLQKEIKICPWSLSTCIRRAILGTSSSVVCVSRGFELATETLGDPDLLKSPSPLRVCIISSGEVKWPTKPIEGVEFTKMGILDQEKEQHRVPGASLGLDIVMRVPWSSNAKSVMSSIVRNLADSKCRPDVVMVWNSSPMPSLDALIEFVARPCTSQSEFGGNLKAFEKWTSDLGVSVSLGDILMPMRN